jgi:glutamate-1-semialdehyde 2,1-aminomutase
MHHCAWGPTPTRSRSAHARLARLFLALAASGRSLSLMRKFTKSSKLFDRANKVLVGGVNSPVRAFKSVGATPLFITKARGARITDADGNEYIDYVSSWGPAILGHAPKGLLKELARVAARGTSFGAPTEREIALAERVRTLMPNLEKIRFVSSGTEATMSAVRVARAATGRDKIIKFAGCYHGHSDAFLVAAGSGATTLGVPTSPGVSRAAAADTLVAPYNNLPALERLCAEHHGQIGALIVEPIAGNMGVVPPARGYLQGLRELCDRERIVLIFDEVISGFRASPGGAQAVYGIKPDLTCLGKIIGGGLPVGAYGGRSDLMDMVAPVGPVYQAGTLSGNPLAMAAGLWTLDHLTPRMYKTLSKLGAQLAEGFADAAREAGIDLQVNGVGSVLTPFFTTSPVTDYDSALTADTDAYGAFFRGMLQRGIYPPPSQFEAWFVSAAHTPRDVAVTVRAARETLRRMKNKSSR